MPTSMPPLRLLQSILIGAYASATVLCAAAGVHGYHSTPQFAINDVPLGADALADVKSIDSLDIIPMRSAESVFSESHLNSWVTSNKELHEYLSQREQVTLRFGVRSPYQEIVVAQLLVWSELDMLRQRLAWPYLAAAIHLFLAVYALSAFPTRNGFLVALACAGLALLYTAMSIPPQPPLTVAPAVVPFVQTCALFGLFGVVALLHFLLRFPAPVLHPVLVLCVVCGLYAYLAIKIALLVTGEFGAIALTPFIFVVSGLLCVAAVLGVMRKDRRNAAQDTRVYAWPIALGAVVLAMLLSFTPVSSASAHLLVAFGLLVPFGLVASMSAQQDRSEKRTLEYNLRNERDLIRRELHDGLLNDLAAVAVTAERLQQSPEIRSPAIVQRFDTLTKLTGGVAARIRSLLKTTSNYASSWDDFFAGIAVYAETVLNANGVRLIAAADPQLSDLPIGDDTQLVNLEHVCREAIVNVLKHSGATEVTLHAHSDGSSVLIDIDDNGHGYRKANRVNEGYGTTHMNRRMAEAGGTVHIGPAPGQGTRVRVAVPVIQISLAEKTSAGAARPR